VLPHAPPRVGDLLASQSRWPVQPNALHVDSIAAPLLPEVQGCVQPFGVVDTQAYRQQRAARQA
jgi:hypothetical protein